MARIGHHLGRITAGVLIACATTACAATAEYGERAEVRAFIDDMAAKHDFASEELTRLFSQAAFRQDIIDAMTRPAERRPWHTYRPIFLTDRRIDGGVEFWREHNDVLQRAEERFGVPPEVITAIIGVETFYGRSTGRHRVLDSLATLAFDYPPRSSFFRGELEQYLILAREEHFDPLELTGSYAGAMGKPQFIPSSYRHYAIDFDDDGQRDLFGSIADVVGSVANYFKVHGWIAGAPVVGPASVQGEGYRTLLERNIKPHTAVRDFAGFGVDAGTTLPPDALASLVELEGSDGQEYWVALNNFYVITRYNRSSLYAMAVYQLAEEIRARHAATVQASGKP